MEQPRCKLWLPKKNRFCANIPLNESPSVLMENLESHVKRCPFMKQAKSLSLQSFYCKGINSGKGDDDDVTSEMKRHAVYRMSVAGFYELVEKVQSVHGLICGDIRESYKAPEACNMWINREIDR
ncbi:tRNA:m(4)X modification enzyme TRM13 [Linum perenne]